MGTNKVVILLICILVCFTGCSKNTNPTVKHAVLYEASDNSEHYSIELFDSDIYIVNCKTKVKQFLKHATTKYDSELYLTTDSHTLDPNSYPDATNIKSVFPECKEVSPYTYNLSVDKANNYLKLLESKGFQCVRFYWSPTYYDCYYTGSGLTLRILITKDTIEILNNPKENNTSSSTYINEKGRAL